MSEIPTLALMISSAYLFYRYCRSEQNKYAWAFVVCSVLSVYSKHTAVVMFPVLIFYFIYTKGFRRLFSKDIFIFSIVIALLILPLLPITLKFSQYNVYLSQKITSRAIHSPFYRFQSILKFIWPLNINSVTGLWYSHLTLPVLLTSAISIPIVLFQRDKRSIMFIFWIIFIFLFCAYFGAKTPRHAIFWIPAFCLLPATLIILSKNRLWKLFIWPTLIFIAVYQFVISFQMNPQYAYGYEETAKYIINNWKGNSVLYCSKLDSGYFVFFIRKHNQNHDRIVLRADKILATSQMNRIYDDRIQSEDDIQDILDKFGIAYVIIQDQKFNSKSLEWLRSVVKSDQFVLRKSIPVRASTSRLHNTLLNIYERKKYCTADMDAILQMKIPLMGETITVRFEDLLKNP